eukprot:6036477-Prorocentrum_lima.AAC.1
MQHQQHRRVKYGPFHGPEPQNFGDSCTLDHWVALDDLSRGLRGESHGITFHDRATGWIKCGGVHDKTADS